MASVLSDCCMTFFASYRWVAKVMLWSGILLTGSLSAAAQDQEVDLIRLLQAPKQYSILKISEAINIDGIADEKDWYRAPWTEEFTDIETGSKVDDNKRARCKMLWDSAYLYVFAEFSEQDIWATITEQDAPVFRDNAFELFVNPDGSTFNYFEFQINALGTVWDLYMPRPYRSGGRGLSSWDIKDLKKAVHIAGTLNNPSDKDSTWSVELAIPFLALGVRQNAIRPGVIWRMNFSRVQWQTEVVDDKYAKKKQSSGKLLSKKYTVWSPQGILNLHYPERWGYVVFTDSVSTSDFFSMPTENLKLMMWKYYYLQQQYKSQHKRYAKTISQLDALKVKTPQITVKDAGIKILSNGQQFWIEGRLTTSQELMTLDHEGEMRMLPLMK